MIHSSIPLSRTGDKAAFFPRLLRHPLACILLTVTWLALSDELQGQAPQTLVWKETTNAILSLNTPYPLSVSASSGLPTILQVEAGPAVIANDIITVTALGQVVVSATQAGNEHYLPARAVHTFNLPQVILTDAGRYASQVVGQFAYMATGGGLQIVDLKNPAKPTSRGFLKTTGQLYDVKVVGNLAYVANAYAGLQIIDVSNPDHPARLGGFDTGDVCTSVCVIGTTAYVADVLDDLLILDVSKPAQPVLLGSADILGVAVGIQVVGNLAYVAAAGAGLQIIDVSNPANPVFLGGCDTDGTASDVQVVGTTAYVADGAYTLQVIDVSKPTQPVRLGRFFRGEGEGAANRLQVVGSIAYVADGFAGVQAIDVSNPANLVRIGGFATQHALGLHLVGDFMAVADAGYGLRFFKVRAGQPQALEWQLPLTFPYTGQPLVPSVTTSSRLPLTFSVLNGPAYIENNRVRLTDLGLVTLRAEQYGDNSYLPATAEWTFEVTPPRLNGRFAGGPLELTWAAGLTGLKLQALETTLPNRSWQEVATPPTEADGQVRVRLESVKTDSFFRLIHP